MANNEQERNDREFRESINERARQFGEQITESLTKAAADAEKKRKARRWFELGRCIVAGAVIAGLCAAERFGLISSVLTNPVYAISLVYIGWHLCKFDRLKVRK